MYVSGFEASLEGWNPAWVERFDALYRYNPARAKELLQEAGYPPGTIHVKLLSYSNPGEAEHPQVVEALAV